MTDEFIDAVTFYSQDIAECVLEGELPTEDQIAEAVLRRELVPCMTGSALKLEGIDELIDVIGRYTRMPEYGSVFGARIYKTAMAEDGERLCFIKLTGGELKVKDKVKVSSAAGKESSEEKINSIRLYSGSKCVMTESAHAGMVCAVTGLSQAMPGDGLGSEPLQTSWSIKPYMVYSVSGPEGMDPYLLMKDLKILASEDPALNVTRADDGGIQIRLMGQVQLEVLSEVIRGRFGYEVSFDAGKVLYLETINDTFEGMGHFEPLRHYAEVHLIIEPAERGSGIVITSETPEDELAVNWQRLIMTHLEEKEHRGALTGAPVTDVRISLAAGRAHDKHTVGGDFREATYRAVRHALMQARAAGSAVLLEPWCEYEIELPSKNVGRAMTDIKQMGGTQDALDQLGDVSRIKGRVPATSIADYQLVLSSYTSGEGRIVCVPCGYDICHNAGEVIAASGYDPERDVDNTADSVFVNHSGSDIVRWDEAEGHMHIGSVLRRRDAGIGESRDAVQNRLYGRENKTYDVKEEVRRRIAAEKELKRIFERTYGEIKNDRRREATEADYRKKPELSEEEAQKNAARNLEIREKHGKKTAQTESRPVLMLIDGYNLIFADEYLKELADRDIGSARDQLIDRISNYAGYTGFEVAVIFDAYKVPQGTGYEEEQNGIRVIYTAQDEPADIRMGKMAGSIKDRQIYTVSSDLLVQQDAFIHGALRISSRDFLAELTRIEEEIRERLQH